MAVRGARQVSSALRELARQVAVPLNAASRFALKPTLAAAKANVQALPLDDSTGALAKSLTIKKKPRSARLRPVHRVGPLASFEEGKRIPVKYAHLVEFGTAAHYQPERGVVHPGARPRPFMGPAYFSTRNQVVARFGAQIGPEMEKRARKLRSKIK